MNEGSRQIRDILEVCWEESFSVQERYKTYSSSLCLLSMYYGLYSLFSKLSLVGQTSVVILYDFIILLSFRYLLSFVNTNNSIALYSN